MRVFLPVIFFAFFFFCMYSLKPIWKWKRAIFRHLLLIFAKNDFFHNLDLLWNWLDNSKMGIYFETQLQYIFFICYKDHVRLYTKSKKSSLIYITWSYSNKGWAKNKYTGPNFLIGIVQKVYVWSSCPFAKMILIIILAKGQLFHLYTFWTMHI